MPCKPLQLPAIRLRGPKPCEGHLRCYGTLTYGQWTKEPRITELPLRVTEKKPCAACAGQRVLAPAALAALTKTLSSHATLAAVSPA